MVVTRDVRVYALDGTSSTIGTLSTFDYRLVVGAAPVLTLDPSSSRRLIATRRGETAMTISFPDGLWTKPGEPPSVEVRVVVR
jgi:hypothetical protein